MAPEPGVASSTDAWVGGWPQTQEEFQRFVDAYLQRLVSYAFRRLGSIHDAEDVVQEVFVRTYAERSKHREVTAVVPYLYRMTANACMDALRKRKRSKGLLSRFAGERPSSPLENGLGLYAASEELQRIESFLRRLPKRQAEVIRLRVFDELRISEIAEVVGCRPNTVSSRLRYGFKKLRTIVSREGKQ
ncbi:MAG: RNA polymerase sigma factor [Candidatus Hydrogenedentes bacterium]|nr:RNA polymerase sigma factor [Candidatus Hydrogenedentota bacterium]